MPHEMRVGDKLVIFDGPSLVALEPPPRSSPVPRPPLDPIAEQLAVWASWCEQHAYHPLVRAAVARVIEGGGAWRASKIAGQHGVRVEGVPESAELALRMAGFCGDAGGWAWWG